jgi:hypothetical protein
MEDAMQTVTLGASHLEVTPIAYGTWQFGGDWEPVDEQAAAAALVREGLTRDVAVSNYSTDQITEFAAVLPAETVQPPYYLFRRGIEADLLPYAQAHHIGVLAYGPLAHGLLGGTITKATTFGGDDWRSHSPAFAGPGFRRNLQVFAAPGRSAADRGAARGGLGACPPGRTGRHRRLAHPGLSRGKPRRPRSHPEPRRPRRNRQHHGPAVPLGGPSPEGMT